MQYVGLYAHEEAAAVSEVIILIEASPALWRTADDARHERLPLLYSPMPPDIRRCRIDIAHDAIEAYQRGVDGFRP